MLRKITVVAFEQAVAAPLATRLLASDGARVIKIERAEGDFARQYDRFANNTSSYFTWLNHGKESCVVDLKGEPEFARKLIERADVVVQNLAPGSMERLGLDWRSVRQTRPGLITVDISGYGECSDSKAYDLLVTAEAGLCSITGSEHGGPGRVGVSIADIMTGRVAYSAVLRALLERGQTGKGASISVSLFDVVAEMMTVPLLQYRATGKPPTRQGMKHPSIAPYGSFQTKDGVQIIISCQNEREWQALCNRVLRNPSLATNQKFCSGVERVRNRDELEALVQAAFGQVLASEMVEQLKDADIAFGRVNNVSDLSTHACLREHTVINELGGTVCMPADAVQYQDLPANSNRDRSHPMVPRVGEDTERIKREFGVS